MGVQKWLRAMPKKRAQVTPKQQGKKTRVPKNREQASKECLKLLPQVIPLLSQLTTSGGKKTLDDDYDEAWDFSGYAPQMKRYNADELERALTGVEKEEWYSPDQQWAEGCYYDSQPPRQTMPVRERQDSNSAGALP